VFGFSVTSAQLTVMASGNFNVGSVSDNGVVSMHTSAGGIYKWDAVNGFMQIGNIANGYPAAGKTVVSNDGTKIASSTTNSATSFNEISTYDISTSTWTTRGGLVPTGWDGSVSSTWGMSQGGEIIVGLGWLTASNAHAVKWTSEGGIEDLGSIVPNRSSSFITDNNGEYVGEAGDVSADGNTIIGASLPEPYVWNNATGLTYISHPNSSAFFRGGATGISADGKTVIGYFRAFAAPPMSGEGFIWTSTGGRVNLNNYAVGLGISTQGVTMSLPLAISKDGKKIAGVGTNSSGQIVAFYLDITAYLSTNEAVKAKDKISIYPNPAKDIIYIKGVDKIEKARIYNMVGQNVRTFDSVEHQIDVSSLSKGTYVLEVFVKGEVSQNLKFIKQ